jgi:hypothetical protein
MNHPFFGANWNNHQIIDMVVKVNPKTNSVVKDESKNTATRIWLEWGPISLDEYYEEHWGISPVHDTRLDCGGKTFEEAVITLANLVIEYYGDYRLWDKELCEKIEDAVREAYLLIGWPKDNKANAKYGRKLDFNKGIDAPASDWREGMEFYYSLAKKRDKKALKWIEGLKSKCLKGDKNVQAITTA